MADLDLDWRGDFGLDAAGDLAMVDGGAMAEQHIVRRLLTAVKGYVWHPEYGAGLPQRIGRVAQVRVIQAIVRAQILLEATVARLPVPRITVVEQSDPGMFVISIYYTDAITGAAIAISFETPGAR